MPIIDQLIEQINQKSSPVVVGLDPQLTFIPSFLKEDSLKKFGNTARAAADAIFQFNSAILDTIHPIVPAVKFQMACYELYGPDGLSAFEKSVAKAKSLDLIVIDDSKRNDIGSTATIYGHGHLGNPPLISGVDSTRRQDFLTINPYLGSDTITPFIDICLQNDKGLFLLVRTSNASAGEYQEASIEGRPLYEKIAADLNQLSRAHIGANGYSPFGAVVGATWPEEATRLRTIMPSSYFLVPGYGAQGGTADEAAHSFNPDGYGAIINSSRGVIGAWTTDSYQAEFPKEEQFASAAAGAALKMRDDLLRALRQIGKLPASW